MSELYDILVETPPTKVILLALDQGLWDCERSLAELAALCEANHMEAVAEVTQKRQTPETGIVLGGFMGQLAEGVSWLSWLNFGQSFGLDSPLVVNFGILVVTFGLTIKITMASIIGVAVALIIYRWI